MLLRLLGLLMLASCAGAPQQGIEPQPDTIPAAEAAVEAELQARQRIVQIAEEYVNHQWSGSEKNAFHGADEWRNQIDTPDQMRLPDHGWSLSGGENVGVPYQWGGFSSLDEFNQGIAAGLFGGHLPTRGLSVYTREAVGVDCSGLVSRCWELSSKRSTRSLPSICMQLRSYDQLLAGDILNLLDRHTMLFVEFENGDKSLLKVIEATAAKGKVHYSSYRREVLIEKGYLPLRSKRFSR
ncbi:MAG: hypothetical protein HQ519_17075 [Planctomycetes bacterium]|nr:hypothetical protein [Planctomycetota bacterium]